MESKYPCPPSTLTGFTPEYGLRLSSGREHLPKCQSRARPHLNPDAFSGELGDSPSASLYILFSVPIQSTPSSIAFTFK